MSSLWHHKNIATGNKCLFSFVHIMHALTSSWFSTSTNMEVVDWEVWGNSEHCKTLPFQLFQLFRSCSATGESQTALYSDFQACASLSSSFQTYKAFGPLRCIHCSMNDKPLGMLQQGCYTLDCIVWLDMLWQVPLSFCLSHNDEHSTTMAHWGPCGKMNKTFAFFPQIRCKGLRPCKQFCLISVLMFYASRREQWILLASVTHK